MTKMNTTTYLLPLAGLAVLNGCAHPAKKAEQRKPLNIVYIMTDDHSYQTMSCYDNRYIIRLTLTGSLKRE